VVQERLQESDSAEKPSVHPSRASGRTEERLKSLEIFTFMLSLSKHSWGFFSRIRKSCLNPGTRILRVRDSRLVGNPIINFGGIQDRIRVFFKHFRLPMLTACSLDAPPLIEKDAAVKAKVKKPVGLR
jgi:hypothetical protein